MRQVSGRRTLTPAPDPAAMLRLRAASVRILERRAVAGRASRAIRDSLRARAAAAPMRTRWPRRGLRRSRRTSLVAQPRVRRENNARRRASPIDRGVFRAGPSAPVAARSRVGDPPREPLDALRVVVAAQAVVGLELYADDAIGLRCVIAARRVAARLARLAGRLRGAAHGTVAVRVPQADADAVKRVLARIGGQPVFVRDAAQVEDYCIALRRASRR